MYTALTLNSAKNFKVNANICSRHLVGCAQLSYYQQKCYDKERMHVELLQVVYNYHLAEFSR